MRKPFPHTPSRAHGWSIALINSNQLRKLTRPRQHAQCHSKSSHHTQPGHRAPSAPALTPAAIFCRPHSRTHPPLLPSVRSAAMAAPGNAAHPGSAIARPATVAHACCASTTYQPQRRPSRSPSPVHAHVHAPTPSCALTPTHPTPRPGASRDVPATYRPRACSSQSAAARAGGCSPTL